MAQSRRDKQRKKKWTGQNLPRTTAPPSLPLAVTIPIEADDQEVLASLVYEFAVDSTVMPSNFSPQPLSMLPTSSSMTCHIRVSKFGTAKRFNLERLIRDRVLRSTASKRRGRRFACFLLAYLQATRRRRRTSPSWMLSPLASRRAMTKRSQTPRLGDLLSRRWCDRALSSMPTQRATTRRPAPAPSTTAHAGTLLRRRRHPRRHGDQDW